MWEPLLSFLTSPSTSNEIKTQALWIVGTAVQNNPSAQNAVHSPFLYLESNAELRFTVPCPITNANAPLVPYTIGRNLEDAVKSRVCALGPLEALRRCRPATTRRRRLGSTQGLPGRCASIPCTLQTRLITCNHRLRHNSPPQDRLPPKRTPHPRGAYPTTAVLTNTTDGGHTTSPRQHRGDITSLRRATAVRDYPSELARVNALRPLLSFHV